MILTSATLTNFRNHEKRTLTFSPGVTLIVGPNAIGKTNILEALYLIASGRSFRAARENDMLRLGEGMARVRALIEAAEGELMLECVLTGAVPDGPKTHGKRFFVNGVARRQIDAAGRLKAVLFSPDDLDLVSGSPSLRRHYLDSVLVQLDREYRRNLQSYERGLRQRNSLLERIGEGLASRSQLLFWDQLLIKAGTYITEVREAYIAAVNAFSIPLFSFRIGYDKSVISKERLSQYEREEVAAKATLVGPHRDDYSFHKENPAADPGTDTGVTTDVSRFGSRGEQRMAVMWFKLAELDILKKRTGDMPVLLLDDIFSELDDVRRHLVLSVISSHQSIITSAETDLPKAFPEGELDGAVVHNLSPGAVHSIIA